ncbi:MAG: bifunctional sugar-1-phosphate nucleotidylyltransferase/acetyltransferase [Candidatus Altiarchaeota archaeon]|nr:bifunctional sugar-1-phosphate nucleotidylyltransferase/acetyltransferase [Candidatus Altiarchaeota archaeon]
MDAVVLAAGEGVRMRPLTSTRPKPMLPVAGKPILEWDLEALAINGFRKIYMIVGYRRESIENYFGDSFKGMGIEYVHQRDQLGTGHAISLVEEKAGDPFLVMNGDLLVSDQLIKKFVGDNKKHNAGNSISLVEVMNPSEFGIVELKENLVNSITEKPKKPESNLANAGIYLFNKEIFKAIKEIKESTRAEYEITDAIETLLDKEDVHGFKCEGRWIDVGRPWDLLDANELMLRDMKLESDKKVEIEENTTLKGEVHVGEGSVIKSGSYIEGPAYIGRDCIVGPNCYIRPYTLLMDNSRAGNAVEIKSSIVMSETNICHLSYIGDSVIGEGCNLGAGTKVANLRFDHGDVRMEIKNKLTPSGRKKLGCIMGDRVQTGINVSILPGRLIYPNSYVEAGSIVRNTIYSEEE